MNVEAKQAEQRRLAWRCRRGLLELDIVLQRFVASYFNLLSTQELAAFDALLALPDNDFWHLISNNSLQQNRIENSSQSSLVDTAQQQIINKLSVNMLNLHE